MQLSECIHEFGIVFYCICLPYSCRCLMLPYRWTIDFIFLKKSGSNRKNLRPLCLYIYILKANTSSFLKKYFKQLSRTLEN